MWNVKDKNMSTNDVIKYIKGEIIIKLNMLLVKNVVTWLENNYVHWNGQIYEKTSKCIFIY